METEEFNFKENKILLLLSLPKNTTEKHIGSALGEYIDTIKEVQLEGPLAYVEFYTHEQALAVHEKRTSIYIKNKHILIVWKLPKEIKESNERNFDLYGLKEDITDEMVQHFFHEHIQILSLLFNHNKKYGNYAIIKVYSDQDVEWIQNNKEMIKEQLGSETFELKEHEMIEKQEEKQTNVLIRNIHKDIEMNEELVEYFNQFGTIVSIRLTDVNEKYQTKQLFVNYETEESAQQLIDTVNGKDVFNKELELEASFLKSRREIKAEHSKKYYDTRKLVENEYKNNYLLIKNIPKKYLTYDEFKNYFASFGELIDCTLVKTKFIGYVCYAQHEDAESCVNAKHEGRMFARFKNLDGVEHQQSPVSPLTQLPFK